MSRLSSILRVPALLAVLLVLSCAPTAPPVPAAPSAPTEKLAEQQTFTWGASVQTSSLHPYASLEGTQRRYDIFDLLVALDPKGNIAPMIATDWKLLDDTTWQMKIRTDVKFHDGTPLTAEDVKFSYERSSDASKKYAIQVRTKTIASAVIVDASTVNIKTKDPDPLFLKRAALVSIVPKAYLERVGDDQFGQKPIGSGPFKMKEFAYGNYLILDGVMDHPFRKPTLAQVTVKYITEASARMAGLRTGDLDFVDLFPVEQVKNAESLGLTLVTLDAGTSHGFWVGAVPDEQPWAKPVQDKRVRQAMNYAIDRDAIVKNIYFGLTKAEQCQVIQPETFGYNPTLKPYPYDPDKAKRLIAEAGAVGAKVRIDAQRGQPEQEQVTLFVLDSLKAIGLDVEFVATADNAAYREKLYGLQARGSLFKMSLNNLPMMDADAALTWFSNSQPIHARLYDNKEFERYYQASLTEMNEKKRLELFNKALEVFCDDPPYLFVIQEIRIWAHAKYIAGIEKQVEREPRLDKIRRLVKG